MKTTVDISDALMARVRKIAVREKTTMRALIEEGLREVVKRRSGETKFELRDASFKEGRGLQPEFSDGRFERVLDASYEGRGG